VVKWSIPLAKRNCHLNSKPRTSKWDMQDEVELRYAIDNRLLKAVEDPVCRRSERVCLLGAGRIVEEKRAFIVKTGLSIPAAHGCVIRLRWR
jgi:hypothetical protein